MEVYLYGVGRNLNRAYRTCEAFGVTQLHLIKCNSKLSGNLFKAAGYVNVSVSGFPSSSGLLALETHYTTPLFEVDWSAIKNLIIGGETLGLPKTLSAEYQATIPMLGKISGLTVEASLAIALYEWSKNK